MNIGDRVRDKQRGIKGTIVQAEAPPGQTRRVLIQADAAPGSAPGAQHSRVWQMLTQVELIDREGKPVQGKPGASLETAGLRVSPAAPSSELGTGKNYDTSGHEIGATH